MLRRENDTEPDLLPNAETEPDAPTDRCNPPLLAEEVSANESPESLVPSEEVRWVARMLNGVGAWARRQGALVRARESEGRNFVVYDGISWAAKPAADVVVDPITVHVAQQGPDPDDALSGEARTATTILIKRPKRARRRWVACSVALVGGVCLVVAARKLESPPAARASGMPYPSAASKGSPAESATPLPAIGVTPTSPERPVKAPPAPSSASPLRTAAPTPVRAPLKREPAPSPTNIVQGPSDIYDESFGQLRAQ